MLLLLILVIDPDTGNPRVYDLGNDTGVELLD